MTKIVDRLEGAGLVSPNADSDDPRRILIATTASGNRKASAPAAFYRHGRKRILERVDPRDAKQIQECLEQRLISLETDRNMD